MHPHLLHCPAAPRGFCDRGLPPLLHLQCTPHSETDPRGTPWAVGEVGACFCSEACQVQVHLQRWAVCPWKIHHQLLGLKAPPQLPLESPGAQDRASPAFPISRSHCLVSCLHCAHRVSVIPDAVYPLRHLAPRSQWSHLAGLRASRSCPREARFQRPQRHLLAAPQSCWPQLSHSESAASELRHGPRVLGVRGPHCKLGLPAGHWGLLVSLLGLGLARKWQVLLPGLGLWASSFCLSSKNQDSPAVPSSSPPFRSTKAKLQPGKCHPSPSPSVGRAQRGFPGNS